MAGCYQFLIFKTAVFKQLFAVDGQYNVLAQQQHFNRIFLYCLYLVRYLMDLMSVMTVLEYLND